MILIGNVKTVFLERVEVSKLQSDCERICTRCWGLITTLPIPNEELEKWRNMDKEYERSAEYIMVGNECHTEDPIINGTIIEESVKSFVVRFERPVRAGIKVFAGEVHER